MLVHVTIRPSEKTAAESYTCKAAHRLSSLSGKVSAASTQLWFFYLWLMFKKKIHENEGGSTLSALFILTLLCTSEIKPPPFCSSLEFEALTAYWVTFCALKLSKNNSL